jgi:hypothetical protein
MLTIRITMILFPRLDLLSLLSMVHMMLKFIWIRR